MPNYSIALGVRAPEVEDLTTAHAKVASLRSMFQQQRAGELQLSAAERNEALGKQADADDKTAREIYARHTVAGPDGAPRLDKRGVLADLYRAGNVKAASTLQTQMQAEQKAAAEQEKAHWENAITRINILGRASGAVKNAPEADRPRIYAHERIGLINAGFNAAEIPEQYDPAVVEAGYLKAIEAKDQATQRLTELAQAEAARHNKAGEVETGRHNVVTETHQANTLTETGRHNKVTETNQGAQITETGRHNRRAEGLTGAQLGEQRRHNQASEATAAAVAGGRGGLTGPAGAKFKDGMVSLGNLSKALEAYKTELQGGSARFPGTEGYAKMESRFTDLQMRMKDLYSLGAITGPDLELLNSALTNPTSLKGYRTTNGALQAQLDVFADVLTRGEETLRSVYNQPKQYNAPTGGITVDASKAPKPVDLSGAKTEDLFRMLTSGGK